MNQPDKIINVMGQCCPMPIIELAKAVREIKSGQIIQISGDDPIFDIGIKDFCTVQGYQLLELKKQSDKKFTALIKC